jgi:hypothetical protein
MISEEASISKETKPSAQIDRGISRSWVAWGFTFWFCTEAAYQRPKHKIDHDEFAVVGSTYPTSADVEVRNATSLLSFRPKRDRPRHNAL